MAPGPILTHLANDQVRTNTALVESVKHVALQQQEKPFQQEEPIQQETKILPAGKTLLVQGLPTF